MAIANTLRRRGDGEIVTIQRLADRYEVHRDTIQNDLNFLRDLGLPVFLTGTTFTWDHRIDLLALVGGRPKRRAATKVFDLAPESFVHLMCAQNWTRRHNANDSLA